MNLALDPMPIQVLDRGGLLCPDLVCSCCGERITDAADAVADYEVPFVDGPSPRLLISHKACIRGRRPTTFWSQAVVFMARALWNATERSNGPHEKALRRALDAYIQAVGV